MVQVDVRNAGEGEVVSIERLAMKEVPGLKRLAVRRLDVAPTADASAPPPAPLALAAPGKRVIAVVDGRPDFITTEDGSRYFSGAVLPSGHRIVEVEGQMVSVEKDGAMSRLVF